MQHTDKKFNVILGVLLGLVINASNQPFAQAATGGMTSQGAARTPCAGWNLATEFRLSPEHANPNPDRCGNTDVWYFMESSTLV